MILLSCCYNLLVSVHYIVVVFIIFFFLNLPFFLLFCLYTKFVVIRDTCVCVSVCKFVVIVFCCVCACVYVYLVV